jgi:hypothetical protein
MNYNIYIKAEHIPGKLNTKQLNPFMEQQGATIPQHLLLKNLLKD